jgi:hypothetical protein
LLQIKKDKEKKQL